MRTTWWRWKERMPAPVTVELDLSNPAAGRACIVARFTWQIFVAECTSRYEECESVVVRHRTSDTDLYEPRAQEKPPEDENTSHRVPQLRREAMRQQRAVPIAIDLSSSS